MGGCLAQSELLGGQCRPSPRPSTLIGLLLAATGEQAEATPGVGGPRGRTGVPGTCRLCFQHGLVTLTSSLSPAEIYHTTFDWPPESEIQNRLMVPAGIFEGETARKLLEYHRNIVRILPSYPKILKVISADQPCVDVFYQGKPRRPLHSSRPCVTSLGSVRGVLGSGGVKSWVAQDPCPETSVGSPRVSPSETLG